MPFFNANPESSDLQLLPKAVRSDEDLSVIAADCEADIIAAFTAELQGANALREDLASVALVPTGAYALDVTNGVYVFLRGYHPTPESCAALLREALRREIASLIPFRREQWRTAKLTQTESAQDGTKVVSYRDDKNRQFPESFGRFLRPYDIRPPAVAI